MLVVTTTPGVAVHAVERRANLMAAAIACRDPTDDKFLELAVNGQADAIVTGDTDLLALNPFRHIPIVTPATFVRDLVW